MIVASEQFNRKDQPSVPSNPYPRPNTTIEMSTIRTSVSDTTEVMTTIRILVSDLFTCLECRCAVLTYT